MLVPVLLSGGSGTRLWPVSRKSFPKQFAKLLDPDLSLLQMTAKRLTGMPMDRTGWVVIANSEHRFLLADQLTEINADINQIILEPIAKNTAPAIALAAIEALKISSEAKLLVLPADHLITDATYFCKLVGDALAANQPMLTFGVAPARPETGYGNIIVGHEIDKTDA